MKINKWIMKENTYKKKYKEICQKLKVEETSQIILKNNVLHICKMMKEQVVDQLMKKLVINKRTGSKVYLREPQKTNSKSSLIRHITLFNALPLDLKLLPIPRLKRKLKKMQLQFKD